ncbi:hypothetical protein GJAV_G00067800 [Gymnothorax javanicus]|nr:hypothetical protein GJAV_G00067800 [Gymnothorax javanicus]
MLSDATCACAQHVKNLNQQISVMRNEIKNLRHLIDSAVRAHRKHVNSLLSTLEHGQQARLCPDAKSDQGAGGGQGLALEKGNIKTVPIGYISSCFPGKNGTPRQPSICGQSRATLRIETSVFNNPHHALVGLEQYSHVWIIFLFHKNGHLSCKAKVKPPRLNGRRVGVYSTRSPHRPNALGLTLAKLEHVTGDTLHLSGIDMIAGTPVLDIKPFIPTYDSPSSRTDLAETVCSENGGTSANSAAEPECTAVGSPIETDVTPASSPAGSTSDTGARLPGSTTDITSSPAGSTTGEPGSCCGWSAVFCKEDGCGFNSSDSKLVAVKDVLTGDHDGHAPVTDRMAAALQEVQSYLNQSDIFTGAETTPPGGHSERLRSEGAGSQLDGNTEVSYSQVASWITAPPVASLSVRFTPSAERDLRQFQPPDGRDPGRPRFHFLRGPGEAELAIRGVLQADPRSVYRRTRCPDRLFYFLLDSAHVTCWFGDGFAEVVRIRPAQPTPSGSERLLLPGEGVAT